LRIKRNPGVFSLIVSLKGIKETEVLMESDYPFPLVACYPVEEETQYRVSLVNQGSDRFRMILKIRDFLKVSLKEAKDSIDQLPLFLRDGLYVDEVDDVVSIFGRDTLKIEDYRDTLSIKP